jgi:hypothetical protein
MSCQGMSRHVKQTHRCFWLVLARQLLQVRHLLVGGHVGGVGHGEAEVLAVVVVVGLAAAVLVVMVLELASVLVVVKACGSEDRGAHV